MLIKENFKFTPVWNIIWEGKFLWICNLGKLSFMKIFNIFGGTSREISTNLYFTSNNFHTNYTVQNWTLCPWLDITWPEESKKICFTIFGDIFREIWILQIIHDFWKRKRKLRVFTKMPSTASFRRPTIVYAGVGRRTGRGDLPCPILGGFDSKSKRRVWEDHFGGRLGRRLAGDELRADDVRRRPQLGRGDEKMTFLVLELLWDEDNTGMGTKSREEALQRGRRRGARRGRTQGRFPEPRFARCGEGGS